jgi:hypothetical protein
MNANSGPVVYVSGPITAVNQWLVERNVRIAEDAAAALLAHGVTAICVHSMGRFMGDMLSWEDWMRHDLAILALCSAVLVVGDWEKSNGTKAEIEYAQSLGIPVFFTHREVIDWSQANAPAREGVAA